MLAGPHVGAIVPGYDSRAHTIYNPQFVDQERELARLLATMAPVETAGNIMYACALVGGDVVPARTGFAVRGPTMPVGYRPPAPVRRHAEQ